MKTKTKFEISLGLEINLVREKASRISQKNLFILFTFYLSLHNSYFFATNDRADDTSSPPSSILSLQSYQNFSGTLFCLMVCLILRTSPFCT